LITKKMRKLEFLDEMNLVFPWAKLTGLSQPFSPASKTDPPPFPISTMLGIRFMQKWFGLSDSAMEEA
jgi:IS5 family transposase